MRTLFTNLKIECLEYSLLRRCVCDIPRTRFDWQMYTIFRLQHSMYTYTWWQWHNHGKEISKVHIKKNKAKKPHSPTISTFTVNGLYFSTYSNRNIQCKAKKEDYIYILIIWLNLWEILQHCFPSHHFSPESVKTRTDLFYLVPERSCIPDSPVWYTCQQLGDKDMNHILSRIMLTKDVHETWAAAANKDDDDYYSD